jgi:hypothetical protein
MLSNEEFDKKIKDITENIEFTNKFDNLKNRLIDTYDFLSEREGKSNG